MTAPIREANFFVYALARIVTAILSFLGFRGPAWARHAVGIRREPVVPPSEAEASSSVARAVAAAGPHAPKAKRGTGHKKTRRAPSSGKKPAVKTMTRKSARERTAPVSSL